jgi:Ala-tRNA(Pro) deacylase
MRTASVAHVPGDRLAKSVLLEDSRGYLMAVVPSTYKVDLGALSKILDRHVGLATESELGGIVQDGEGGAIPPRGQASGVETVLDESLTACRDVYFEAGDHHDLVHVSGGDFLRLMGDARRGRFSHHV